MNQPGASYFKQDVIRVGTLIWKDFRISGANKMLLQPAFAG